MFNFHIITLFPEMFDALGHSIPGRALKSGAIQIDFSNPRDFTEDNYRTIDDRPYGGGPGMVMMAEPLTKAINHAKKLTPGTCKVCYLSPQGQPVTQRHIQEFSSREGMILVSGRYEGIDERVIQTQIDEEWSIGDYVLSGGELPAMVLIDAVSRLLPGVLGHDDSANQDSFSDGLLDTGHYTRPIEFAKMRVPEVLSNGNHAAIARWRHKQALGRTWLKRPDLFKNRQLNDEEGKLLTEFIEEYKKAGVVK